MSTPPRAKGREKSTPDGGLPLVGEATREPLSGKVIEQLRRAGLVRPRPPYPGQTWRPRTEAEQHLLLEGYRLDRIRQLLLAEVGRLRGNASRARREDAAAATQEAKRLHACPLTSQMLAIIAAAAAGETPEETAKRLCLAYETVKSHRQRAVLRLHARSMTHAVAICVMHGWVTARQIEHGVTP